MGTGGIEIQYPPHLDGFVEQFPLCYKCHNCEYISREDVYHAVVKCSSIGRPIYDTYRTCPSYKKRDWFSFSEAMYRAYRYKKVARASWSDKSKYLVYGPDLVNYESETEVVYVYSGGEKSLWVENEDDVGATDWYVV